MNNKLYNYYTNPSNPGSFSGASSLIRALRDNKNINFSNKKIKNWLLNQETYTLHKPKRKNFIRKKVIVSGIDDTWQADLVDVSNLSDQNDGYKFILTVIDVFSKYAWAKPLKNKSGKSITDAFSDILNEIERKPLKIQTDEGTEFYNSNFVKYLEKLNIKLYSTKSELKALSFNRVIKSEVIKK